MNIRLRIFVLLIGALVVLATFTFPLWQPLLENNQIEEVFPGLAQELQPPFAALPADQQLAYFNLRATDPAMSQALAAAALGADILVPTEQQGMPTMGAPIVIATGSFTVVDVLRWAEGDLTIYQQFDNSKVIRIENFRSARGPNLHVILWATSFPEDEFDFSEFVGQPVPLGNLDIDLGLLQGTVGNQNYLVPPQVDLTLYNSVVIYCFTYNMIYSIAAIQ